MDIQLVLEHTAWVCTHNVPVSMPGFSVHHLRQQWDNNSRCRCKRQTQNRARESGKTSRKRRYNQWVFKHQRGFTRRMKWKMLSGRGNKGNNMVAWTMLAMWGLLKMGRPEAQIKYRGSGRKCTQANRKDVAPQNI